MAGGIGRRGTLREARDERSLGQLHRRLQRADVIVLDELGFVPFDRAGGELTRQRCNLLALPVGSAPVAAAQCIAVPPALAAYAVESARAADYDWLLGQGGRS